MIRKSSRSKVPLKVIKYQKTRLLRELNEKHCRVNEEGKSWKWTLKLDIDVCVWRGYKKNNMRTQVEWKIAVSTNVFLPYFDINGKKQRRYHTWKICTTTKANASKKNRSMKKSRLGKNTIFSYVRRSATNSELERRQGFSQLLSAGVLFSLQLFFHPATT